MVGVIPSDTVVGVVQSDTLDWEAAIVWNGAGAVEAAVGQAQEQTRQRPLPVSAGPADRRGLEATLPAATALLADDDVWTGGIVWAAAASGAEAAARAAAEPVLLDLNDPNMCWSHSSVSGKASRGGRAREVIDTTGEFLRTVEPPHEEEPTDVDPYNISSPRYGTLRSSVRADHRSLTPAETNDFALCKRDQCSFRGDLLTQGASTGSSPSLSRLPTDSLTCERWAATHSTTGR